MTPRPEDRTEQMMAVAVLALLIIGCTIVLRPFLTALLWALILCISSWPGFEWFQRQFNGRATAAAAAMTFVLFLLLLVPIFIVGSSVADTIGVIPEYARSVVEAGLPGPPAWLADLPVVGQRVFARWQEYAADPPKLGQAVRGYILPVSQWLLGRGARLGAGLVELALGVLVAFFLFRDGEAGVRTLEAVSLRLGGERARRLLGVAAATMKAVIYGVLGGAFAQAVLTGIGLWIVGIHASLFLGLVTFFVAVIPPGPALVWLPSTIWLFTQDELGWAIFLAVWGVAVVGSVDNFIRPYFISRGGTLPFLLTFLGLLGGIAAFGLLGIFIGPTLLAVGFSLLKEWSRAERQKLSAAPSGPASRAETSVAADD